MKRFFLLLILTYGFGAEAQTGDLRGFVFSKADGSTVEGAIITLSPTGKRASTDKEGFYSFGKVPAGDYQGECHILNFDTVRLHFTVYTDRANNKNFYLSPSENVLAGVYISDQRNRRTDTNKINIGHFEINPSKDFSRLPMVGGEPDAVQYLQILPGVVTSGDQGGQLYIRGGSPVMNKVLLDGMTIYNPFHSIGLFSVFDGDFIKTINVYSAGFNAQYGGRVSAVLDVQTKDGNKKYLGGKVSLSPFAAKAILEGPLKKFKEGEGSSTYLISYKNSFLDRSSKQLYRYAAKDNGGLPFSFQDLYTKFTFSSPSGSKANLFYFNFNDRVNYPGSTSYGWKSQGGGVNFSFVPEGTSSIINGVLAFSDYQMEQTEPDLAPRYSHVNGFNANINFTYYLEADELKYGMEINGFKTDFKTYNAANRVIQQVDYTTELCGYVKYRRRWRHWVLEPGLRGQFYASLGNASIEPRFNGKVDITSKFRMKTAAGLYSQNLMSAVSDRDVVNLFYGFLSGPDDLPLTYKGSPVKTRLQKSRHLLLGFEYDFTSASKIEVEGYWKYFNQLTNINRDKIYDNNAQNQGKPELQRIDFIIEHGNAQGLDFKYTYTKKGWFFWTTYSLTYVNRMDEFRTYFPHFDRRHNLNTLLSYMHQSKKSKWYFNCRWNFGSGFPFTKSQGFYEVLDFASGVSTDYTKTNGSLGIQYADINSGRLPYLHRMDISIERKQELAKREAFSVSFSLTNVYNRQNIFYFDRVKYRRINQLPIMPALAMNYTF